MDLKIFQTRRFKKALEAMHRAGKNERAAVRRAEKIIAALQVNPLHEEAECKRTKYGELRLHNCRKYDLACGYRLIGLKRQGKLIFIYIGSHDDCQRWIENNRENLDEIEAIPVPLIRAATSQHSVDSLPAEPEMDEYEKKLMGKVDEQILREIFAGLCQ